MRPLLSTSAHFTSTLSGSVLLGQHDGQDAGDPRGSGHRGGFAGSYGGGSPDHGSLGASGAIMRSERSGPRRPAQDACEVSPVRQLQALLRQNFGAFAERCFYELSPSQTYCTIGIWRLSPTTSVRWRPAAVSGSSSPC